MEHTYMYVYIPKYNMLSLYNIACLYVFRADHLVMDKQSSWRKLFLPLSLFLSYLWFFV